MAIEKMELVNIAGLVGDLDEVLLKCCQSNCFHIELAIHSAEEEKKGLSTLNEENPYTPVLRKILNLSSNMNLKFEKLNYSDIRIDDIKTIEQKTDDMQKEISDYTLKLQDVRSEISLQEQALRQLKHLSGIDVKFERLFACEFVKIRVGKLPVDSYPKLAYYDDKNFFFIPFETTSSYVWGCYFVPNSTAALIDDIFASLYFERIRIPDFVKGTAEKAFADLAADIQKEKDAEQEILAQIEKLKAEHAEYLNKAFVKLKFLNDTFELRKMVATINGKFYMIGFVPKADAKRFEELFDTVPSVSIVFNPPDSDSQLKPPTKLKNGFFSRPFSMLVEMYGLPSYGGINPTTFFAITYTLLFGIMFGDLGQGAIIFAAGLIMTHAMKQKAGGILSRIGLSSMIFGTLYGSVFGYEHLLDPLYHAIGFKEKPLEVFKQTNFILITAVAIGVLLIIISITMNIITGFKQKDYVKALFGNNGLAGLVFYVSVVVGGVFTYLGYKVFTLPFILGLIVLPLALMFFRAPLANFVRYKKTHVGDEEEGIGIFIAENVFELFEFLLSYITNTMSFLRVGGFVLSHAGMMLVVMTLAEGVSAGVSPIIVVFGNIFVMAMEGMIVGIQVVRLEFYEIFSRFYEGDGKPFVPVSVNLDTDIE